MSEDRDEAITWIIYAPKLGPLAPRLAAPVLRPTPVSIQDLRGVPGGSRGWSQGGPRGSRGVPGGSQGGIPGVPGASKVTFLGLPVSLTKDFLKIILLLLLRLRYYLERGAIAIRAQKAWFTMEKSYKK